MSVLRILVLGCLAVGSAIFSLLLLLILLFPIQALPRAQVDVHGVVIAPPDPPVTVTLHRPGSYGLTASERAAGLPPLNEPVEEEAVLADSFTVALLPASYCVTTPLLARTPPPPISLTLSFSDAPGEAYTITKHGEWAAYSVRDAAGIDVAPEQAAWKLTIGEPVRVKKGYPSLWTVELRVERQSQPPRRGTAVA